MRSVVQLYPGPLGKLQNLIDFGVGEVLCFKQLCDDLEGGRQRRQWPGTVVSCPRELSLDRIQGCGDRLGPRLRVVIVHVALAALNDEHPCANRVVEGIRHLHAAVDPPDPSVTVELILVGHLLRYPAALGVGGPEFCRYLCQAIS